jgi:hypothetical protein
MRKLDQRHHPVIYVMLPEVKQVLDVDLLSVNIKPKKECGKSQEPKSDEI